MLALPLSFSSFPSQSVALSAPQLFFSLQAFLNCPAWFLFQFMLACLSQSLSSHILLFFLILYHFLE